MLPHNTKATTCPPGSLPRTAKEGVPTLMVATFRRTGTHVLIDIILNNFRVYKGRPLFLDLDQWVKSGRAISDIPADLGCVIKTHLPNQFADCNLEELATFCKKNSVKVISTTRGPDEIFRSLKSFFQFDYSEKEFQDEYSKFHTFWDEVKSHKISFSCLVNQHETEGIIKEIEEYIGVERNKKLVPIFLKQERKKVFFYKILTRFMGKHSPKVNTTIGFSKTK